MTNDFTGVSHSCHVAIELDAPCDPYCRNGRRADRCPDQTAVTLQSDVTTSARVADFVRPADGAALRPGLPQMTAVVSG
jgi:hypothetical protein